MPGLDYKSLPAAQVKEITDGLHARWQIEANVLRKTYFKDARQGKAKVAQLNAKYQRLELDALTELQGQVQADQRKEELITGHQKEYEAGGMTPARRAVVEAKYTEEEEQAIFGAKPKYISPAYLRSGGFRKNIENYAGAATDTPGWEWGPPKKVKSDLIAQYERWRESELYDIKEIPEQQQLDKEWNMLMLSSPAFNKWWQDKSKRKPVVEARALQSTGRIGKAMRDKIVGQTPLGRSLSINKKSLEKPFPMVEKVESYRESTGEEKPIIQRNKVTGERRISYDGGRTWQKVTG